MNHFHRLMLNPGVGLANDVKAILRQKNIAAIHVSHDIEEAEIISDRTYRFRRDLYAKQASKITRLYKHNLRDMPAVPIEVLPYIRGIQLVLVKLRRLH